jgi:tetratricopeptide (TPR) repeat protein
MQNKHRSRGFIVSLFVTWSFMLNSLPLKAQDVVTSDDISGGFAFRISAKAAQKKVAFRAANKVKRVKKQVIATTKRIRKQAITVATVKPKRTKTKEVRPETVNKNILQTKPKEEVSRIFAGVGEYYLKEQNWDKAIEFFRGSFDLDAKNTAAKLGLSEALTRKGDSILEENPNAAKFFYDEAIQLNDKNAGAYAGLGEMYDLLDDNDKALENYKKALALDKDLTELNSPIGILLYQKGDIAEADTNLTRALVDSPDNAETQLFLGLIRYSQNRNDEALAAFRRAVQIDPTSAEAHYYLGEVLDRLKNSSESIAAYKKAIELNPKYTEAWFDLGVAYYNSEQYELAVDAYKQTIKLKNDYGEAYANLGDSYRQLKKYNDALGAYRLASAFLKTDADVFIKYGFSAALASLNPGQSGLLKTSMDNFQKAVELSPGYIEYTNLGWAYLHSATIDLQAGNKTAAQEKLLKGKAALLEAVKLNPKFAAAHLNLGITQRHLGENKAAIETLKQADSLRANWLPAINELGQAYRSNNEMENAARQFKRMTEIDKDFPIGHFNYAEAHIQLKNMKEAKKAYQELLRIGRSSSSSPNATLAARNLSARLERMTGGKIK